MQALPFHAALPLACELLLRPENLSHGTKRRLFREEAGKGSRMYVRQIFWYLRRSRSLVPLSLCFSLHLGSLWGAGGSHHNTHLVILPIGHRHQFHSLWPHSPSIQQ